MSKGPIQEKYKALLEEVRTNIRASENHILAGEEVEKNEETLKNAYRVLRALEALNTDVWKLRD
jgi:hypothetical protein